MNLKFKLLLIFVCTTLFAENVNFSDNLKIYLQNDTRYQQELNSIQIKKAKHTIDKSVNWFDLNFNYQNKFNAKVYKLKNDYTTYNHEIVEYDKSYSDDNGEEKFKIELSKTFFSKDFDDVYDKINRDVEVVKFKTEIKFFKLERISQIIDDLIEWGEANSKIDVMNKNLKILKRENDVLTSYLADNLIETTDLIENLEDISKINNELSKLELIQNEMKHRYKNSDILISFQKYCSENVEQVDLVQFSKLIIKENLNLKKSLEKIQSFLNRQLFSPYLPEFNFAFSYNKKTEEGNWEVWKGEEESGSIPIYDRVIRDDEFYPEAKIEFSLPFNIFGNTIGKRNLQKELRRKTQLFETEIIDEITQYKNQQILRYKFSQENFSNEEKIFNLQKKQLEIIENKYELEPSLFGITPEISFTKEKIKYQIAEIEYQKAKTEMKKEIFLINYYLESQR